MQQVIPKIGIFGIGLDTYWPQFEGLEARLSGYVEQIGRQIDRLDCEIVNAGLVDSYSKARAARECFRQTGVDLVFVYMTTYALSATVLQTVRGLDVPIVLLNLQPSAAPDFAAINAMGDRTRMTGEWLAYCSACTAPEIVNALGRAGIATHQVTGVLSGDTHVDAQISQWVEAARVTRVLDQTRLGLMGRYYNGMLDIYTDVTALSAIFGVHVEILETDALASLNDDVSSDEIAARRADFDREFEILPGCIPAELDRAARTSVALERLVNRHELGALAYYYEGANGSDNQDVISSIILGASLLIADDIPVAGEYEVKNVVAMKIMAVLRAGGSFSEFYAIDFDAGHVLFGHDGPGHPRIAEGRTKVRPLEVYHGKVGSGVSVEMSVRCGPVTLLSVAEAASGGFKLVYAEGECVSGAMLEIGNTNSRYTFPLEARSFVEAWNGAGPAHHCAIGTGHLGGVLNKIGVMLGIGVERVC